MQLTFRGRPAASEVSSLHVFDAAVIFASGFVAYGAPQAAAVTLPSSSLLTISIYKLSGGTATIVGLAQVTSGGAWTFTASPFSVAAGDALLAVAPSTQDPALADVSIAFDTEVAGGGTVTPQGTYLTLNGVPIFPDYAKGFDRKRTEVGPGVQGAQSGTPTRGNLGFLEVYGGTCQVDQQASIESLRRLIQGGGDHWQLDAGHTFSGTIFSDKGVSVILLTSGASASATGGKWTSGYANGGVGGKITLGTGGVASFENPITYGGAIVGCWHCESGTWHAYLFGLGANGAFVFGFKDAAPLVSLPAWLSTNYSGTAPLSPAAVVFSGTSGDATAAISDVFIYPFSPPSYWGSGMAALQGAQAWPQAGFLLAQGEAVAQFGSVLMVGASSDARDEPGAINGAPWLSTLQTIDFVLTQAEVGFA